MRPLVLGGGVIGVTSAGYLARAGYEVTVVDRGRSAGSEASFANAGQILPGYAAPWAAPGMPLEWLLQRDAPLVVRPGRDPQQYLQYLWLLQMPRNGTAPGYAVNRARMVRFAECCRDCLDALRRELRLDYKGRQLGTLQLFRTRAQLEAAGKEIAALKRYRVSYEILDRAGAVRVEPALASTTELLPSALRLPCGKTGDSALFTRRLAESGRASGVKFHFRSRVGALEHAGGRVTGAYIDGAMETSDRCVVALDGYSPTLLALLSIRVPVYPPGLLAHPAHREPGEGAPASTVIDESYKVAITRFDARARIGGLAGVCGFDRSLPPRRRGTLEKALTDWYPHASDLRPGRFWTGLRPATPDGTPVVGGTRVENLYINTGHSTLGCTMACGSGQYLADVMAGVAPEISIDGMDVSRYHQRRCTTRQGRAVADVINSTR